MYTCAVIVHTIYIYTYTYMYMCDSNVFNLHYAYVPTYILIIHLEIWLCQVAVHASVPMVIHCKHEHARVLARASVSNHVNRRWWRTKIIFGHVTMRGFRRSEHTAFLAHTPCSSLVRLILSIQLTSGMTRPALTKPRWPADRLLLVHGRNRLTGGCVEVWVSLHIMTIVECF